MPPDSNLPTNDSHRPVHKRRKWLGAVLVITLLAVAGVLSAAIIQSSKEEDGPSAFETAEPAQKPAANYCSLAGTALICQDIKAAKATKYVMPAFVGTASRIVPSPDEKYYFIQTPANPLPTTLVHGENTTQQKAPDRVYVVNQKFEIVKALGDEKGESYIDIDWAADSKSLVYAQYDTTAKKTNLYVYDVPSAKKRTLAADIDVATLFVTANGQRVLVSDAGSAKQSKLGLQAISFNDGSRKAVKTDSLKDGLEFYANYTYDRVHDRLYVSGSNAKGPAMIIAKPLGGDEVSLSVVQTLQDGYAYTPLVAVDDGMFAARQKDGQNSSGYGVVRENAAFVDSPIKPSQQARFGIHGLPSVQATADAAAKAEDYVYSYTEAPQSVKQLAIEQAAKDCPSGQFNTVSILAYDQSVNQAALQFASCQGAATLRYFVADQTGYKVAAEATGIPSCEVVDQFKLSKTIAPVCETL